MEMDDLREAFRAGSNLQDDREALARFDRPRVGELPTQALHLGEVGIECGDDLGVHPTSRLTTTNRKPGLPGAGARPPHPRRPA